MVGDRKGFISEVRKMVPDVKYVHCMIYREQLASQNLGVDMNNAMKSVIAVVNFIKGRALNSRTFRHLRIEMGSELKSLLYHTEVIWLSRDYCNEY